MSPVSLIICELTLALNYQIALSATNHLKDNCFRMLTRIAIQTSILLLFYNSIIHFCLQSSMVSSFIYSSSNVTNKNMVLSFSDSLRTQRGICQIMRHTDFKAASCQLFHLCIFCTCPLQFYHFSGGKILDKKIPHMN